VVEANPAADALGFVRGLSWAEVEKASLVPAETPGEFLAGLRRIAVAVTPLDSAGGRIVLLHDVTEAHRLKTQAERNERLAAMGEMAAQLAHQLRTPLAAALLYAGNLEIADLPAATRVGIAQKTVARLKHLERLIQDMLLFARGEVLGRETFAVAEAARRIAEKNPHVKMVYTAIGGGAAGSDPFAPRGAAEVRKATLTINLTPRKQRGGIKKQALENELREALAVLPGVQVKVGLGGSNEKYVLVLASENGALLAEHARTVERELRTLPGIGAITTTASLTRPELVVRPDFARMADLGVTSAAIADVLRIATAGDYDQSIAKLNLAQRQVPIVVMLPAEARQDLSLLERLTVPGKHGPVMIGAVAALSITGGPAEIDRYDRLRNINFEIELNGQPLGEVEKQALALPSLKNLPPGILQTVVGDAEAMAELFASFGLAMLTGVLCIYVVLVLLFKDFVQPATILAALVLSVPGAFLALFVTQSALSMPSMIGLIMLMGIATKNSILLIDYVVLARREYGLDRWHALLDACSKRARPIVMTTVAMGAGMTPIAIGLGTDPSFRAPMAIVVIGGLITSTFLSLLVIPVVFTYVDDLVHRVQGLLPKPHA